MPPGLVNQRCRIASKIGQSLLAYPPLDSDLHLRDLKQPSVLEDVFLCQVYPQAVGPVVVLIFLTLQQQACFFMSAGENRRSVTCTCLQRAFGADDTPPPSPILPIRSVPACWPTHRSPHSNAFVSSTAVSTAPQHFAIWRRFCISPRIVPVTAAAICRPAC